MILSIKIPPMTSVHVYVHVKIYAALVVDV